MSDVKPIYDCLNSLNTSRNRVIRDILLMHLQKTQTSVVFFCRHFSLKKKI